ncbi:hypothetical protein J4Q44_G00175900 [Coregonus suidteri]|uniref:Uncharacterized protein n=1 Tax=Coregonus suidteri TaxID=861788 RepID=A0AAN8M4C2_9TELE
MKRQSFQRRSEEEDNDPQQEEEMMNQPILIQQADSTKTQQESFAPTLPATHTQGTRSPHSLSGHITQPAPRYYRVVPTLSVSDIMDAREEMLTLLQKLWTKLQGLPTASSLEIGAFAVLILFIVVFLLLLLITCLTCCCCRRTRTKGPHSQLT